MAKGKKELLASAPWRVESEQDDKFKDARLKVTSQPGQTPTMHVPGKKSVKSNVNETDDSLEIDPELRYSFQRNFQSISKVKAAEITVKRDLISDAKKYRTKEIWKIKWTPSISVSTILNKKESFLQRVFSIDTVVKPLPPAMAYNVARNLTFFTSIFTQFFDPEGIANAQKSLGLGQEEKVRKVR